MANEPGSISDRDVDTSKELQLHFENSDLWQSVQVIVPPAAASAGSLKIYRWLNDAEANQSKLERYLKSMGFRPTRAKTFAGKMKRFLKETPVKGVVLAVAVGEGIVLLQTFQEQKPVFAVNDVALKAYLLRHPNLTDSQKVELIKELESGNTIPASTRYRPYIYGAVAFFVTFAIYLILRWRKVLG
jgi:hypothetical protein